MATPNRELDAQSGWTQYQKLVLAELERHDDRQSQLEKELVELKLTQAGILKDIASFIIQIKELNDLIKEKGQDISTIKKTLEEYKLDIKQIQWKMGIWVTMASALATILIEIGMKFFFR